MILRPVRAGDYSWIEGWVAEYFGSERVVSRGHMHNVRDLPGLVAEADGEPVGLVQYALDDERGMEVVILVSKRPGTGKRLLAAMAPVCAAGGRQSALADHHQRQHRRHQLLPAQRLAADSRAHRSRR